MCAVSNFYYHVYNTFFSFLVFFVCFLLIFGFNRAELQRFAGVKMAVWLSANVLVLINKVTLRRARFVLGWVTICGWVNRLGN